MRRIGPTDLLTARYEAGKYEAEGRYRHLGLTPEEAARKRDPGLWSHLTSPRDFYQAWLDPSDLPRIRLGLRAVTIAKRREERLSAGTPDHMESIRFIEEGMAGDEKVNSLGMLILIERDEPNATLHVLEGWHRTAIWEGHCRRGHAYPIRVNIVIHRSWAPRAR